MNLQRQVALIMICWILSFWCIRQENSGIIMYQLNNSAWKKRKKGMTFKEWFFYTRFKKVLPKPWVWTFFILFFLHVFTLIILIPAIFIPDLYIYTDYIVRGLAIVDLVTRVVTYALLWSPKEKGPKYERWVKRYRKKDKL